MAKKKVTPTEGEELQPTDPITPTSPEETGSEPTPTKEAPNEDAAEEPVEGADTPPATKETPTEEEGAPEEAETDEAAEAEDTQEDVAPTALSDLAAQILRDHDLKVVFLTSDGTAFYGYSDALNYAQTLEVKDVYHFFATPPTDDEMRELLPPSLRPNHLQA